MDRRKKIVISLFIVLMIFPFYVTVSKSAISQEAQLCLGCHSARELTRQLESRETLSLYINGDEFAKSAHNIISCAGCHMDISMETHPQMRKISSKKEYSAMQSKTCSMCHPDELLEKNPVHGYIITKVKKVVCSECHGAHYIKKISEWKAGISEPQYCLTCHRHYFSKTLESGEVLPLYVNESALKASVHKNLTCGVCHMEFSKTKHPVRTFKSRQEYSMKASRACLMCHPEEQLRKNPAHGALITSISCVECHGSHNIQPIAAMKEEAKVSQYCLSCHRSKLTMTFKDGDTVSLYVNESALKGSVHGTLQCTECHSDFSITAHPVRTYGNRAEYSRAYAELCRKCHADASAQYERSIHYSELEKGNVAAPSCTGCHGSSHSITKATADKTLGLTSCNKCHADMYNSYKASIHEEERIKGKENTPTCASCHKAHDVEITAMTTAMKDACMVCHDDGIPVHNQWLYNPPIRLSSFTELHINSVACAACHSPDARRGIYLTLYDKKTGKPFPQEDVLKLLETDAAGLKEKIDINGDGIIDSSELWNFYRMLNRKGAGVTFMGNMNVQSGEEAHRLAEKSHASRECVLCHRPDSEYFKDVFVVIRKADGKPTVFNAKQEVIGSVYSILPVSKFYALGSSNARLLDYLFIIALIGGVAVPIGHIALRIIASPLRSLRKMGKGGKK
jgi:hypothetical protein